VSLNETPSSGRIFMLTVESIMRHGTRAEFKLLGSAGYADHLCLHWLTSHGANQWMLQDIIFVVGM